MKAKNVSWNISESEIQISFSAFTDDESHFRDVQLTFVPESLPEDNPEKFIRNRVQLALLSLQLEYGRMQARREKVAKIKSQLASSGLAEVNLPELPGKPTVKAKRTKNKLKLDVEAKDAESVSVELRSDEGVITTFETQETEIELDVDSTKDVLVIVTPKDEIGRNGTPTQLEVKAKRESAKPGS